MAITFTAGVSLESGSGTSHTTGSFTPAAGDLLYAYVNGRDTVAAGSMTDTQGVGWDPISSQAYGASDEHTGYLFVSKAPAAASSMTVTFDCTGDSASAVSVDVYRVAGMSKFGSSAVRQSAKVEDTASAYNATFGVAPLTTNACISAILMTGPSPAAAVSAPTSWTRDVNAPDSGFNFPNRVTAHRVSGETGTTPGFTSADSFTCAVIMAEFDITAVFTSEDHPTPRAAPPWPVGGTTTPTAIAQWKNEQNEQASGLYIPIDEYYFPSQSMPPRPVGRDSTPSSLPVWRFEQNDPAGSLFTPAIASELYSPANISPPWPRGRAFNRQAITQWSNETHDPGAPHETYEIRFKNFVFEGETGQVWIRDLDNEEGGAWGDLPGSTSQAQTGGTWTPGTATTGYFLTGAAWSESVGLFVAVGTNSGGTAGAIFTSSDGVVWTQVTAPASFDHIYSVVWFPLIGKFVAIGISGTSHYSTMSSDGVSWTPKNLFAFGYSDFFAIAASPTIAVIVGPNNSCLSSINGTSWILRTITGGGASDQWSCVTWNGAMFAAGQLRAAGDGLKYAASADGITWTRGAVIAGAKNYTMRGIAYNATSATWCMMGDNDTDSVGVAFTSLDGTTWTAITNPLATTNNWRGLRSNGRVFVATSDDAPNAPAIWISTDGKFWTKRLNLITDNLFDFAFSDSTIVGVGEDSVHWTSP